MFLQLLKLLKQLQAIGIDIEHIPAFVQKIVAAVQKEDLKEKIRAILEAIAYGASLTTNTEADDKIVAVVRKILDDSGLLDLVVLQVNDAYSFVNSYRPGNFSSEQAGEICTYEILESQLVCGLASDEEKFASYGLNLDAVINLVKAILQLIDMYYNR